MTVSGDQGGNALSQTQTQRLGAQTAVGTVWLTAANYTNYAISLVSGVILARLLDPADFGVVALALSLTATLSMLTAWGLGAAIVARREIDERFLRTNFSLMLMLASGVLGITALITWAWSPAEPLAALFLLIFGALQFTILTAQMPQLLLERGMRFRRLSMISIISVLLEATVALGLAWAGFGVWSLVAGRLAGGLTQVLGYWSSSPWRPALALDREMMAWNFGFGKSLFIVNNLTTIQARLDDVLVGIFAGKAALGLYSKSFQLSENMGNTIAPGLGQIMRATFRTVGDDTAYLSRIYRYVIWGVLRLIALYSGLVALLAVPLVSLIYGEKWLPMVPMLRLLLVYGGLQPIYTPTSALLVVLGRQETLARVSLAQTALFLPGIIVFTFLGGAIWAAAVVDVTRLLGIIWLVRRIPADIETYMLRDALAPLLAGILAGIPVWLLMRGPLLNRPNWVVVLWGGISFMILYGLLLWLLERRRLVDYSTSLLREIRAGRTSN